MKNEEMKSLVEIFICNHNRDDEESCAARGSKDLTDKVKKWTKENYGKEVKVFRSGCLGKCSEGIAVACYPEKKMFLDVDKDDDKKLKNYIEETYKKVKRS